MRVGRGLLDERQLDEEPRCRFAEVPFDRTTNGTGLVSVDDPQPALRPHVASDGYRESFADYAAALGRADVVVSTARHEFYGLALLEAVAAGCAPLAPRRLAYPEVLAEEPLAAGLYDTNEELVARLTGLIEAPDETRSCELRAGRRAALAAHDAGAAAARLDRLIESATPRPARQG